MYQNLMPINHPNHLQWGLFAVFAVTTVLVLICLTVAFIRFWRKDPHSRHPQHASMFIEMIWMMVPFAILLALAYPVIRLMWR